VCSIKEGVEESPSDPGYGFVRELKEEGTIDEFRAVEPKGNWDWEYELDGTSVILQLRGEGAFVDSEIEHSSTME
jgi:hypothetical protein